MVRTVLEWRRRNKHAALWGIGEMHCCMAHSLRVHTLWRSGEMHGAVLSAEANSTVSPGMGAREGKLGTICTRIYSTV